jgi:hypothetical protein
VLHGYRWERLGFAEGHLSQSSSAFRFTAAAFGFLDLTQCGERPELYGESRRLDTMPSRPSLQACSNTSTPSSSSRCSLNRRPGDAAASTSANVALRTASGSRRRSAQFSSIRSKAYRKTLSPCRQSRIRSKLAIPSSPQATASPSMMQERARRFVSALTMGEWLVRPFPDRLSLYRKAA